MMRFNKELYKQYRKLAGRQEKDGVFSVTRFNNGLYCFATKQKLGNSGKIDNHPMLGKKFKRIKDDKTYTLDSVCIHWYDIGYYYHATLRDNKNSHVTSFIENINCNNEWVLESIAEFNKDYKLLG